MTYYLYIKTHNKTGIKYLGQTRQNPFKYKGSGKRWPNHINHHGNDVTTEIIKECETKEELKSFGIYYSFIFNVVNDPLWANLKIEEGDGGWDHIDNNFRLTQLKTKVCKKQIRQCLYCKINFECVPSDKKKYCSRSCGAKQNNKLKKSLETNTICYYCKKGFKKASLFAQKIPKTFL